MHLKFFFPSILALMFFNSICAQLIVGTPNAIVSNGEEIDSQVMRDFRKTTTVFFYNEKDAAYFQKYGDQIKEGWTITPLEFVPAAEARSYYLDESKNYSYFSYSNITVVKKSEAHITYVSSIRIYLDLSVPDGEGDFVTISRLVLGPDIKNLIYLYLNYLDDPELKVSWKNKVSASEKTEKDIGLSRDYLYSQTYYTNFYPGIFRTYLKEISSTLENGETRGVMSKPPNNEEGLKKLAEGTLVIPENIFVEWKKMKQEFITNDTADFLKNYDYKYVVKSAEEINDLFLAENKPSDMYVLVPAISNSDQYINVYSLDGEWLYNDLDILNRDYSQKDFKKLSKEISKAVD